MYNEYYSSKALRRLFALLAISAGGAGGVHENSVPEEIVTPSPILSREVIDLFNLPRGVKSQVIIQPIVPTIQHPIQLPQHDHIDPNEQPQAAVPYIPNNQIIMQGLNPGGGPLYTPKQAPSAHRPGQAPINTVKKIKMDPRDIRKITNEELLILMKQVRPREPQPVKLTQRRLTEYLNNKYPMPVNAVNNSIRLLNGGRR